MTGFQPVVHVLVHFGAAETAIAPARVVRKTFAGAIAERLRRVREYTHHGLKTRDTFEAGPRVTRAIIGLARAVGKIHVPPAA
jgi:hypothetical protein